MNNVNDPVLETINTYDSVAFAYKERYQKHGDQNQMKPFLDKFIALLGTGTKVLDIGGGAGFDAKYLVDKGIQVTSIDLSDKMLEVAKQVAPGVEFIKMDMRKMTFADATFDGVWASASLLHIPKTEIEGVIDKISSILKTGGVTYLGFKQGEGEKFVVNEGKDNLAGARRFFSFYSPDEMRQIITRHNFEIVEFISDSNRENVWMNFMCKKN
jgi:ubiquinone/menaquinone biosynthesis C-methylase UbiE